MGIKKEFGQKIKRMRLNRRLTQEKLSELCDCATSTIGCIEIGRQAPSFEMIINIANALEIHPADLFLRNSSTTVNNTKKLLKSELLPQIENFIEKRL